MGAPYRFPFEIVESTLLDLTHKLEDVDLDEALLDQVEYFGGPDGGDVRVFPGGLTKVIAAASVRALMKRSEHAFYDRLARSNHLEGHEGCAQIIHLCVAERNDLIGAIDEARSYCHNDVSTAPGIGVYVTVDRFLEALRPQPGNLRSLPEPFACSNCGSSYVHEAGCPIPLEAEDQQRRSRHEIEAHVRCAEVAAEVAAQTDALYQDIDEVALFAFDNSKWLEGEGEVVDPVLLLRSLQLDSLMANDLLVDTHSVTAKVVPALDDPTFCSEDSHSLPHRACRYLVEREEDCIQSP